MATHSSILAWKLPWTEEPGRLQSMGSLRVRHDWATSLSLFTFMYWRRKWQPTPVFLPGESQGQGSLVGCRLRGRRVRHDWSDLAAAAAAEVRSQDKLLLPKLETLRGEYRKSWLTGAETHKPQPSWEPEPGQGNLNCHGLNLNWIPGASVWTSLRVKNSREAQSRWRGRRRAFLALGEFLPPGDLPGSHKEEQSKLSECFSWGGKSNHHEIFQTLHSINQGCPQERLVNLSLTCWGFIRPHWPPGGEIPNCSPLSCAI